MPALPIVTGEDQPILHTKTTEVPKVTKEIQKLIKDMQDTVIAADGLGIAAPQIGLSLRVCITQVGGRLLPMVNPYITSKSEEIEVAEEGCLSLPKIWAQVPRSVSIVVKYTDEKGKPQERALSNLDARVVQHEVDHLDGKLITDYGPHGEVL